ncbi:MAG: hypothetical protein ACTH0V_00270 [Microbacteriaceae bacterium]
MNDSHPQTSAESTGPEPAQAENPTQPQPQPQLVSHGASERPALRTPWSVGSYGAAIRGSGARKLSASSVAPLVAAARGYVTIAESNDFTAFRRRRATPKQGSDGTRKEIMERLRFDDVLGMPWHRLDAVLSEGPAVKVTTAQYRPGEPAVIEDIDDDGQSKQRVRKYVNELKDSTPLDVHPATPESWGTRTPRVLFIEGLLKADAALTHVLLESGISAEELSDTAGTLDECRARLQLMMERVPEANATLIVAFVGVGNWHAHPEWNALNLRDRTCYVGFDADMASNAQVWRQAEKLQEWLERKKADHTRFLRLDDADFQMRVMGDAAMLERIGTTDSGAPKRMGLDDFLANVGSWQEAIGTASATLPDRPLAGERPTEFGEFRVRVRGTEVHEYVQVPGVTPAQGRWERRVRLGARVRSMRSGRVPTALESIRSLTNPDLAGDQENSEVEIEFRWLDRDGLEQTSTVRGPSTLLNYRPEDWVRRGARIPPEILRHPEWPPTKHGTDWLQAVKEHRYDEADIRTGWSVMGWVPTDSGRPAFAIGNQILAEQRSDELSIAPGVTDEELPGASRFGVDDYYQQLLGTDDELDEVGLAEYKRQIREDIRAVVGMFFDSGAFGRMDIPAAIIGAMLRPACPPRPQTTLMFYGPPAGGKSYASAAVMGGWRADRRSWHENSLPGQAGDTAASHELAVSMTPIWVADDLAPSTDRAQAEKQEAAVSTLIRNIFNGAAKRRTELGWKMRESNEPRALLVATAENEPTIDSVRDRSVMIEIGRGTFADNADESIDRLRAFFTEAPECPRLVAALIRYWFLGDGMSEMTWQDRVELGEVMRRQAQEKARAFIEQVSKVRSNRTSRHANLAGELAVSFAALESLARWAGIPSDDPLMDRLSLHSERALVRPLFQLVADTLRRQAKSTPGASLITAINSLLGSGRAHLGNPDDPGAPPFPADAGGNEALGWVFDASRGQEGAWVPRGTRIGYLSEFGADSSELVALLAYQDAFGEAKRHYPNLLPHGAGPQTAWSDVWNQGYAAGVRPERTSTVQVMARAPKLDTDTAAQAPSKGPRRRIRGIPVKLDALRDPEAFVNATTSVDGDSGE